jgi:membrane-associated phospholipid phosphatase
MQRLYIFILLSFFLANTINAQQTDSSKISGKERKRFYKTGLFKATIVPAVLIGYGISTIHGNGFYSSYDAYRDVHKLNFKGTHLDNYLQYAPYAELALLNIFQIKCKNDFINTGILIIKSELLMNVIVFPLKALTHIVRPDSMNPAVNRSFPSGHTANAFLAASIVHQEYKHKSIWYGISAYTLAVSVGAMRMLNNRHWEADVFAGAGIGILSVHLAHLTHRYKWGKKSNFTINPTYQKGNMGLSFLKKF